MSKATYYNGNTVHRNRPVSVVFTSSSAVDYLGWAVEDGNGNQHAFFAEYPFNYAKNGVEGLRSNHPSFQEAKKLAAHLNQAA